MSYVMLVDIVAGTCYSCRHYSRLQPIVQVRLLRMGLGQGCSEVVAGPNEILLDQSDLTAELKAAAAVSVETGSSLGFLMLGGHGRELVREDGDSWYLSSQVDLLPHRLSNGRLVHVTCRGNGPTGS